MQAVEAARNRITVNSRQRSTWVAFGAKRTLTEPRSERPKIANRAKFCVSIFALGKTAQNGRLGAYSQNGEYNRYAEVNEALSPTRVAESAV